MLIEQGKFPIHARALGSRLISYVLNEELEQIDELMRSGGEISDEQYRSLAQLDQIVQQAKSGRLSNQQLEISDRFQLQNMKFKDGGYVLSRLRQQSAGTQKYEGPEDPVKSAIHTMCEVWFPFILLPAKNDSFPSSMMDYPSFHDSSEADAFIKAVEQDATLMLLYPNYRGDPMESSNQIYTSLGQGFGVQLVLLHSRILSSAQASMELSGVTSLSNFQSHAYATIDRLRSALRGEEHKVPLIRIFDHVGLPPNFSETTEIGVLKSYPSALDKYVMARSRPARGSDDKVYGCVLEDEIDYRIFVEPEDFEGPFDGSWPIPISSQFQDRHSEILSLCTAFVFEDDRATAARSTASITSCPLNGATGGHSLRSPSLGRQVEADLQQANSITKFLKLCTELDMNKIDLSVRRFNSAIHRSDNIDSLIDAVIGLESLFGQKSDIAFSVATSVSLLLAECAEDRSSIFSDIKKIYSARSDLVHGNKKNIAKIDVNAARNSSVNYLRRVLMELIEHRTDLISLDQGSARAKSLVIGS
ncbi:MAG: HEPN domain-containing protein [Pseudomonadaceae bacterium]|nr:HEPN domain-containing protein [Pseudomonadaceae bacterium]